MAAFGHQASRNHLSALALVRRRRLDRAGRLRDAAVLQRNLGRTRQPVVGDWVLETNKVWRPIGYRFAVWFANSSTVQAGFRESYLENPVVTSGSFGYDWGSCLNEESFSVSTVTCQIYNWYA